MIHLAKPLTAADKAKSAAMNKQGAALLNSQKNGTYKPPTPTPAAQAKPTGSSAPSSPTPTKLPAYTAPVSQVSNYTGPPLGNQKVGQGSKSNSSAGSSSGRSSSGSRGGNAAASLAGLKAVTGAVNNALASKGKAPIGATKTSNLGRTGVMNTGMQKSKGQASRLSDEFSKFGEETKRFASAIPELGKADTWKEYLDNNTARKYLRADANLPASGAAVSQVGNYKPVTAEDMISAQKKYSNSAEGKADQDRMMNLVLGISGEGVAKAGAKAGTQIVDSLAGSGKLAGMVNDILKSNQKVKVSAAKDLANIAKQEGATKAQFVSHLNELISGGKMPKGNVDAALKEFDGLGTLKSYTDPSLKKPTPTKETTSVKDNAANAAKMEAGIKPTAPTKATDVAQAIQEKARLRRPTGTLAKATPDIPMNPAMNTMDSVAGMADDVARGGDRVTAGIGRQTPINERVTAEARPTGNRVAKDGSVYDPTVPRNMTDFGSDFRRMGQTLDNTMLGGSSKFPKIAAGLAGGALAAGVVGGALNQAGAFTDMATTQDAAPVDDYQAMIDGITGGTAPTDTSGAVTDTLPANQVATQSYSAPSMSNTASGFSPSFPGGGGGATSGGYSYGNAPSGAGGNAVETTYYQLDQNGNPISEHIGYIINGVTYTDPNGQQQVPENSLVRTVTQDGTENYYLKNDAYSNGQGGYNPYETIAPGGTVPGAQPPQPEAPQVPEEQTADTIMQQIMDANNQYLQTQYAQIDSQVEAQIQAMKESYAARGLYNSDALITEEQRIREEGEAQKDALYGQVLSEAYQTAMQYDYQNRQLDQNQSQFESSQQMDRAKLEQDAAQFAAQLGVDYQKLSLQEKEILINQAMEEKKLQLGYYEANQRGRSAASTSNGKALDSVLSDARAMIQAGYPDKAVAQYITQQAPLAGATQQDVVVMLKSAQNTSRAFKARPQ